MPVQELIDLESGRKLMTAGRLYTIAKAFDVPVTWFFDDIGS
jgi:transcriptional regulator with XRE-family HTH domain